MTRPEQPVKYVGWESTYRPPPEHTPAPQYHACPDAVVEDWPGHGRHDWEKDFGDQTLTVKCRGYRMKNAGGAVFVVGEEDPRGAAYVDNVIAGKNYPGNRSPGAGYRE